jgi:hypothetical protein
LWRKIHAMLKTLNLDPDVVALLDALQGDGDASLDALVNDSLRRGLSGKVRPAAPSSKRIEIQTFNSKLLMPIDNVWEAVALAEGESYR